MIYRQKPQKSRSIKTAPKTKTNMRNYMRGIFFCAMWYLSIIAGFFVLICPVLPLAIISPRRYRRWSDTIFGLWEPFPVAMMEVCFGIRVILSGDKINPFEGSLFVMNHRTRVDWNFLWLGLFHCCQPNAHNMKYILKASIMHFPGPGWVMQTCSFIFVHRNWERDKPLLNNIIEYLNESDSLYQILIFPEGTDLTEKSMKKSDQYAEENNLQKYQRVLHPKTTGFAFIARKMRTGGQLKAVYDVTIAYPKSPPQNEGDLLRGKFPKEVHFHVKRYSSSVLPSEEADLKSWLAGIWKEKEEKLHRFYTTGCFTGEPQNNLYSLSNQDIDFGKMSIKNGVIKYEDEDGTNIKEIPAVGRTVSGVSAKPNSSKESAAKQDPSNSTIKDTSGETASTSNAGKSPSGMESIAEVPEVSSNTEKPPMADSTEKPVGGTESEIYAQSHMNCDDVYRSKYYRPSHLLYLVLVFWLTLTFLTIHQLFYNFYLQIWVLTHSVLFTALSLVSNGFHHVAAAMYFYKYGRKTCLEKKSE